jgi:hypothetical protein
MELTLGNIHFTGEGEAAWLEKQVDKLLGYVKTVDSGHDSPSDDQTKSKTHKTKETLSAYLKSSSVATNQVKKFLATACWLTSTGNKRPATGDITRALSDNQQGKLGNPADCLNQNVKKGFCVKEGKQFYVTEEGFASLGKNAE